MRTPTAVDAREPEWGELLAFATGGEPHATLGLVSGRLRTGKSTLLRTLAETRGGFYHRITAIEDATILEVSTPELDDVIRLEDRYGRQ